ncbi:MAG: hypothetical protein ACC642_01625 [Pseudomonadales bacterium]
MKLAKSEQDRETLIDPSSKAWEGTPAQALSLSPVPLEAQPNEYIRASWATRSYGKTGEVSATALADNDRLYVRLQWEDDPAPNEEFPDAAALVLGNGDLGTLGSSEQPLSLWYWAADRDEPLSLTASGPGVFARNGDNGISGAADLSNGRWSVVIAGPLAALSGDQLGVVVWNGSNQERAGLAAVSSWVALEKE